MPIVKTRAFVETVVWTINTPHCSRYVGLPVVVFILLHVFPTFKHELGTACDLDSKSFV